MNTHFLVGLSLLHCTTATLGKNRHCLVHSWLVLLCVAQDVIRNKSRVQHTNSRAVQQQQQQEQEEEDLKAERQRHQ
jgi:hypothetical protein